MSNPIGTGPAASGPGAAERLPRALVTLALTVMLGAFAVQLDATMVGVATNTLLRQFDAPLSTLQWVGTGYLLAMAVVIPLTGWAVDRFGFRATWVACVTLFLAGSLLCGAAWSAGSLIGFRVVQGLGGGMLLPLAQAVLARAAGPERMGRLMGVIGVPAMLGPVLGPVLGGLIVADLSWRWIFYVNVPVCLAAVLLALRTMPTDRATAAPRPDLVGLCLLSPALAAIVYGLSEAGSRGGFTGGRVLLPLVGGLALLAGFVAHALRAADPLVDLRLLRLRSFAASTAVVFLAGGTLFGAMVLLPLYYQQVHGDSALRAGALLAPQGVGLAVSLIVSGRLTDRIGPRPIVLAGLLLTGAGTLVFTQVSTHTGAVELTAALLASGAGLGAVLVPVTAAALRGVRSAAIPRAVTATRIFQQVGASFGGAVLAVVLQRQIADRAAGAAGGRPDPAALAGAFGSAFWWALAFLALAAIPALLLPATPPTSPSPPGSPVAEPSPARR